MLRRVTLHWSPVQGDVTKEQKSGLSPAGVLPGPPGVLPASVGLRGAVRTAGSRRRRRHGLRPAEEVNGRISSRPATVKSLLPGARPLYALLCSDWSRPRCVMTCGGGEEFGHAVNNGPSNCCAVTGLVESYSVFTLCKSVEYVYTQQRPMGNVLIVHFPI